MVDLRFTATVCQFAQAIYYARAEAFALEVPAWETLTPHTRRLYVEQSQNILNANRPVPGESTPHRPAFPFSLTRGGA